MYYFACCNAFSQKYALLIGNSVYQKEGYTLGTPKKDVQALENVFKKAGFQVKTHYNLNYNQKEKKFQVRQNHFRGRG